MLKPASTAPVDEKAEEPANPYLVDEPQHPTYEVQVGDSLMKIAYLNNVSERSLI